MTNEIPPLGGYKDVADIVGTTRQNIYGKWQWMKNGKRSWTKFPRPYIVLPDGKPLWDLDEVDEYARKNNLGKYKPAE